MAKDEQAKRPAMWLHFRVPAEVHDDIRRLADKERRSISQMTSLLIEDGLAVRRRQEARDG